MAYPYKQSEGAMKSGGKKIGDGYRPHNLKASASSYGATVKESKTRGKDVYKNARPSK